ncbi:uncharacterized protein G2W53_027010 [Senna tora]|uniref:Uncharacterized protein n=1 Tax=Senna tora TaxID=362788 RepID=A0A834WFM8_9FABA|nr:uncharacterized protein G2W53_027010 [Senna tora]
MALHQRKLEEGLVLSAGWR